MILNQARCDYLTLTTFDQAEKLQNALHDLYPEEFGEDTRRRGYSGLQWEGLFAGKAKQRGRPHYMIRASGEESETIMWRTADIDAKCTRIDLQITIRTPQFFSSRGLFDKLMAKDTKWPGKRLKARIIQSGDKLDTVYIGSRTSERFYRIYVKPDDTGKPAYIRFEVEFKRSLARAARSKIVSRETIARSILSGELHRLPVYVSRTLELFHEATKGERYTIQPEQVYSETSRISWIENQVEPTIYRLLLSHQEGDRIRALLRRWAAYAVDLNDYTDMRVDFDNLTGGEG